MTERTNVIPFPAVKAKATEQRAPWFEFRNQTEDSVELWIHDVIDSFWGYGPKEFIEAATPHNVEGRNIYFHINSPGGNVFEGYVIANFIRQMDKARTIAKIDGLAASIASVIACSCDEVQMPKNSMMMIHEATTIAIGRASDLRASADLTDKINGQIASAYGDKRKRTLGDEVDGEDFAAFMTAETWMTAEEAVALGLADTLLDEVKIAACVPEHLARLFNHVPEELIVNEDEILEETPAEEKPVVDEEDAGLSDEEQEQIRAACDSMKMSDKADGFITNKVNINDVRAQLIDARAKAQEQIDTTQSTAPVVDPNAEAQARARSNAIAALNSQSIHNRKNTK